MTIKKGYFFDKIKAKIREESFSNHYYIYKGYKKRNHYPVILYFKKNEIIFAYKDFEKGIFQEIFSLSIKPGKLNQIEFINKFENYWKMPLWFFNNMNTTARNNHFEIDRTTLIIGYYNKFYEFNIKNNRFILEKLFDLKRKDVILTQNGKKIIFKYFLDDEIKEETWKFSNGKIKTDYINFRKLILDFIYELNNNAYIFDDENFNEIQPILTNNDLFFALIHKCKYIDSSARIKSEYSYIEIFNKGLPKAFKELEKEWINICTLDSYKNIFTSKNSIFYSPEKEIDYVILKAILKNNKKRYQLYSPDDSLLWNRIITFYLHQYSLWKSFKILFANMKLLLLGLGILTIYIFLNIFSPKYFFYPILFMVYLPAFLLISGIYLYYKKNINLFKLLLPRLSLGILLGWLFFITAGKEIWRFAFYQNSITIILINTFIFLITLFYVVTDIKNKTIINPRQLLEDKWSFKKLNFVALKKGIILIIIAAIISSIQGIYIISLFCPSLFEHSKLVNEALGKDNKSLIYKIDNLQNNIKTFARRRREKNKITL